MANSETPPEEGQAAPSLPTEGGATAPPSGEPARAAPPPAGEATPPARPPGETSQAAPPAGEPSAPAQPPAGEASQAPPAGRPMPPAKPLAGETGQPAPPAKPAAPAERPARPARPAAAAGEGAPAEGAAAPAAAEGAAPGRPARPARPAAAGEGRAAPGAAPAREGAPARPAPAARPARGQQPAEPPPPDPVALAHPISKALEPLAPELSPRIVHTYLELTVPAARLLEAMRLLRDQFDYDYLSQVTATDWPDRFEMIYTLYHLRNWQQHLQQDPDGPKGVMVRVNLPRVDEPRIVSLVSLWPGAELQEREVYDMFGIRFVGHPDLRRILLDDDFPGWPLRKDFTIDPEYVLVRHLAHGVEGQLGSEIDAGDRHA